MTNIYMAGSISHSPDGGRGWRTELQGSRDGVTFLSPLDEHDPRDGEYERSDIVPDDLSLLDRADGILLRYEHGRQCWGTPMEQGWALANDVPVSVWWDELETPISAVNDRGDIGIQYYELEDASPWLTDPACSIGVFWDRDEALNVLLSEIGGPHHDCTKTTSDDADELTVVDIYDAFDAIEDLDGVIAIQRFYRYFGHKHTDRVDELMYSLQDRGEVNISADGGDFYNVELSHDSRSDSHGFLPPYVTPVSDYRGVVKR